MLIMPYRPAMSGCSSVLSFKTVILPSYSFANSSTIGATIWHGPHHTAQKSTSTRSLASPTSASHVVELTGTALPTLYPPQSFVIPLSLTLSPPGRGMGEGPNIRRIVTYASRNCQRTIQLHPLRSRHGMTPTLREDLEVVNQILEIGGTQTRPARHLFVERVASGINASDDGRLDRFPVEGWMAAVHELVLMPLGIREGGVRDVGRRDAVHHAAPPVRAVAHGAPHACHAVAVLHDPSAGSGAVQENPPAVVRMGHRHRSAGAGRHGTEQQDHRDEGPVPRAHVGLCVSRAAACQGAFASAELLNVQS